MKGNWYECTSEQQDRKSYTPAQPVVEVTVPVASLVPQHDLEFIRDNRAHISSHLSKAAHVALMSHNYSKVIVG